MSALRIMKPLVWGGRRLLLQSLVTKPRDSSISRFDIRTRLVNIVGKHYIFRDKIYGIKQNFLESIL